MTRHIVPDEVLNRPESLAEMQPLARLPTLPFAFIWFLVAKHFSRRVAVLVALASCATAIDAFGPLALSHLINAIGHAYAKHLSFALAVLPWIGIMGAIWFVSASVYRCYETVDIETSVQRHRAPAFNHRGHGPHRLSGGRAHRRRWPAPRALGKPRRLCAPLEPPDGRLHRRGVR